MEEDSKTGNKVWEKKLLDGYIRHKVQKSLNQLWMPTREGQMWKRTWKEIEWLRKLTSASLGHQSPQCWMIGIRMNRHGGRDGRYTRGWHHKFQFGKTKLTTADTEHPGCQQPRTMLSPWCAAALWGDQPATWGQGHPGRANDVF